MTEPNLLHIGFDRFIAYEWAEYALNLALNEPDDTTRRMELKSWLQSQIAGVDAARKTYNLLARIWFVAYPETAHLRTAALQLVPILSHQERLALHWNVPG